MSHTAVITHHAVSKSWYYENSPLAETPQLLVRQPADVQGRLNDVAFSPDGRVLAAGGESGKLHLWSLPSGQESGLLLRHLGSVRGLSFAPQGRWLASVGGDWLRSVGELKLWSTATGREAATLWRRERPITAVSFAAHGLRLAAGAGDGELRLWDGDDFGERVLPAAHADEVLAVRFASDGRLLATASADQTIRLWDADRLEIVRIINANQGTVRSLAFHPGRPELLASAGDNGTVRLWDLEQGTSIAVLDKHQPPLVPALSFTADGAALLYAVGAFRQGSELWRWDLASSTRSLFARVPRTIYGLDFAPDGGTLATAGLEGSVRLWSWA
jgi:WD40 repeat protein